MENFIRWYDGVIPPSLCDQLIDIFESSDHKVIRDKPAKHNTEVAISSQSISDKLVNIVRTQLRHYVKENDFDALLQYKIFDVEGFAIKKYEPVNDFHTWHTDSTGPFSWRRFLAIQCYLNTVEEGGHTEFKIPGADNTIIQPVKGRLVFFPTAWTHEHRGVPPISGPKYSMNGYLLCPNKWIHEYYQTMAKYRISSSNKRI